MPAWLTGGLSRAMRNEFAVSVYLCLESIPNYLVSALMIVFLVDVVHMFERHGVG